MATLQSDKAAASGDNRITFRADDELNEALRIAAVKQKRSISEVCVDAVSEYLAKMPTAA
jgi:predicted transcriptional regulator